MRTLTHTNPAAIRMTAEESMFVKEMHAAQFSVTSIFGAEKMSAFATLQQKGGITRNKFGYHEINQNAIDGMQFNRFIRLD